MEGKEREWEGKEADSHRTEVLTLHDGRGGKGLGILAYLFSPSLSQFPTQHVAMVLCVCRMGIVWALAEWRYASEGHGLLTALLKSGTMKMHRSSVGSWVSQIPKVCVLQ